MMWMSESGNKTRNNKVGWVLWVHGDSGWEEDKKPKNWQKRSPKICVLGTPGRGVLRFWDGVYRKPRSDFGFFGLFFRKCADLGVDVI